MVYLTGIVNMCPVTHVHGLHHDQYLVLLEVHLYSKIL